MQTTVEITEARPTSHGSGNKLASPTDQETSHLPVSQASGNGGSAIKSKAGGRSTSGKGFLKRKCPLWLKRKGPTNSPQGLAISRSRLCVEATHESPIQAVRKPAPHREALSVDSEDSTQETTGSSLLRKLWCLKATNSKLKKPPLRWEMSPLQRVTCGPIATLSRTADPQGESPLRWKPRAETQNPEEVGSLAKPEKVEADNPSGASWLAKPWRTLRTTITARAKKISIFSGNQKNPGASGERVLCLPAEPETSPATKAKQTIREQNNVAAVEDNTAPSTPPSVVDQLYGAQEGEGGHGTPPCRLESHGRMEAISPPVPELPVYEVNSCGEENPIHGVVPELEGMQATACNLAGGIRLEAGWAGAEDQAPEQEDEELWPEASVGEDLAELAENPGGQGMVMATRGLGWLNSEGLGGPRVDRKTAIGTRSNPNTQGNEEEVGSPVEFKRPHEQASGISPDKTTKAGCSFPPALSENGTSRVVAAPSLGPSALEEVGLPHTTFSQETSLPEPRPELSSRELERGAEGSQTPSPIQGAAVDPPRENSPSPGSSAGQWLQPTTQPHGATGPEEAQKRLIYVAAVEIVEAAIDAAAEQLAKKREQEKVGHGCQAEVAADSSEGAATCQRGWLA